MHSNQLTFFRVTLEHMVVNVRAVQRQAGLEMMIGGHAALAFHMGPQEDMAQRVGDADVFLVCQECSIRRDVPVAGLAEIVAAKQEKPE